MKCWSAGGPTAEFLIKLAHLSQTLILPCKLQALPTAVVEPPIVGLLADAAALLAAIECFGRILAPMAVTAADLSIKGTPDYARAGDTLSLRMPLNIRHAGQSTEEVAVSLGVIDRVTIVKAGLESPGIEPQALVPVLAPDSARRSLVVSLHISPTASTGARVVISTFKLAG